MSNISFTHILCRLASEIFLKGKNQSQFISKLKGNIQLQTKQNKISTQRGRITLPFFENHHKLKLVFGLQSYSPAIFIQKADNQETHLEDIKKIAKELMKDYSGTFHCKTKRSDKEFFLTSIEVNHSVGGEVEESNSNLGFQLKNPDHILGIEITLKGTYLYSEQVQCLGGLPAGIEGEALVEVKDKADVIASLLMMKRGVSVRILKTDQLTNYQSILESFSPRKLHVFDSIESFEEFLKKNQPCVAILGDTIDKSKGPSVKDDIMYLRPLVAWTEEQVETEFSKYQKLSEEIN